MSISHRCGSRRLQIFAISQGWISTETGSPANTEHNWSNTQVRSAIAWSVLVTFRKFQVPGTLNMLKRARHVKRVCETFVKGEETHKKFRKIVYFVLFLKILDIRGNPLACSSHLTIVFSKSALGIHFSSVSHEC